MLRKLALPYFDDLLNECIRSARNVTNTLMSSSFNVTVNKWKELVTKKVRLNIKNSC